MYAALPDRTAALADNSYDDSMLKLIRDWHSGERIITESAKVLRNQAARLDRTASASEKEAEKAAKAAKAGTSFRTPRTQVYRVGTQPFHPESAATRLREKANRLREEARQLRERAETTPSRPAREHWVDISGLSKDGLKTQPRLSDADRSKLLRSSKERPGLVGSVLYKGSRSNVWLLGDAAHLADSDLTADDVMALLSEAANKRRLKLDRAHALMAMRANLDAKGKRQPIPQDVKLIVWQRDGGRCVECGSQEDLEYDHIIPLAMGGSNTDRNLQLLCAPCNQRKGASLG